MAYGATRALARWPARSLRMAATAFAIGVGVGPAFILFEAATGRLATVTLYNALPITQPGSLKGFVVRDGEIVRIAPGELNAMVAVMLLALWPALLCVMARLGGQRRLLLSGALFAAAALAIFLSNHDSSKVGLAVSLIVFLAAIPWPAATRKQRV